MSKFDEFIQLIDGTPEESERIRKERPVKKREKMRARTRVRKIEKARRRSA